MRILLVEDDPELADYVARTLNEEGNIVSACFDGQSGLRAAQSSAFDIIVLDLMLPVLDGFEVIRRLRANSIATPILLLTARDSADDIVRGLDAGADDYLTKPFLFEVLLARLRARTRGTQTRNDARILRYADLVIDGESHEAWRGEIALNLTRAEFVLLQCLMRSPERIVTRQRLMDTIWGVGQPVGDNNLDVLVSMLRTKVDSTGRPRLIRTNRGLGYSLRLGKA